MVFINDRHINEEPSPGAFGGSMCTCKRCTDDRIQKNITRHRREAIELEWKDRLSITEFLESNLIDPDILYDLLYKVKSSGKPIHVIIEEEFIKGDRK